MRALTQISSYTSLIEKKSRCLMCFLYPSSVFISLSTKCIAFLDPKIWEIVPEQVKQKESFECFQRCNKKWSPTNCPCRLCKIVLHDVGFLQQFA